MLTLTQLEHKFAELGYRKPGVAAGLLRNVQGAALVLAARHLAALAQHYPYGVSSFALIQSHTGVGALP
jgi:hypothetical protein